MKKHKYLVLFITVLLLMSIIIGFIYGLNNSYDITNYLNKLNTHNKGILIQNVVLLFFLLSSLSIFGFIIEGIYISLEGISIGYIISLFYLKYKLKGIIYSLLLILINKFVFILILIYFFISSIIYSKRCIKNIFKIDYDYFYLLVRPLLNKFIIIFISLLMYTSLIYFFGNSLLKYFTFML